MACRLCGKRRKYDKSHFRKLPLELCRACYAIQRKATRVTVLCPRCGRERTMSPSSVRNYSDGYCRTCPRLCDSTIPDNYDAGYVVGVMLGDGYLAHQRVKRPSGSRSVAFSLRLDVRSEAFARKFLDMARACTGAKGWIGKRLMNTRVCPELGMKGGEKLYWRIIVISREWYEKLRPIERERQYDLLSEKSDQFAQGFVDGMIDSEGYINPNYTDISNKDVQLLDLTAEFLRQLGHSARVYGPYPYARGVAHLRVSRPLHKTR